jgi:hypothetical protein
VGIGKGSFKEQSIDDDGGIDEKSEGTTVKMKKMIKAVAVMKTVINLSSGEATKPRFLSA